MGSSREVILPDPEDIVDANWAHIHRTGGRFVPPDNLMHPDRLKWVLDAVRYPLGTHQLYPTVTEKASILGYTIVCGHVFHDGNKRTGLSVLQTMLVVNGFRFCGTDTDVIAMGLRLADTSPKFQS